MRPRSMVVSDHISIPQYMMTLQATTFVELSAVQLVHRYGINVYVHTMKIDGGLFEFLQEIILSSLLYL